MREYQLADIRNFAIVGHGASGKTILSEAMLYTSGKINRLGSIVAGNTTSDYHKDEHERQISIYTTLLNTEWLDRKFNIIDTPGYLDFIGESLGALKVVDFSLVVLHAGHGIEVGTEKVWEYATDYGIPKVLVVNALDKEHVNFDQVLEDAKERFGRVFPMTIPVNSGPGFNQVLDVLQNKIITYRSDKSGKYDEAEVTEEWKEKADKLHQELIENVAESDDSLLEKFFDQGKLSEEEMQSGLHAAIQSQSFIPLFATAADLNVGVSRLMDFIAKYGSSPADRKEIKAVDEKSAEVNISVSDSNPVLYIFKTFSEAHVGELSFFRVFSGSVKSGIDLYNSVREVKERIGQIFILNGKNRENVKSLQSGDIGAAVKLKDTHTNNTLCSYNMVVKLPEVDYPKPNIHSAIKPKSKGEEEKMASGLATIHEEDPTFVYRVDPELHQTIISGQGELHLRIVTDNLKRRFNVEIDQIKPKVPYRETVKGRGDSKYRHKKQTGGAGQFAEVWMTVEPKPRSEGIEFKQSLVGQNVDRVFVPSVEKGVKAACKEGILAGYYVADVKANFYDGKQHPVDSKDVAFQIAGKHAFKEAFLKAKPCLLEPILKVEVKVPEDCMGDVMGDISSRRGKILGMDSEGRFQVIRAKIPQGEMYHYSNHLRSVTGGRGLHTEEFSHYNEMPRDMERKVIEESKAAKEKKED